MLSPGLIQFGIRMCSLSWNYIIKMSIMLSDFLAVNPAVFLMLYYFISSIYL